MSAQELNNETFPGIEAVNGFYTAYYMQEYFPAAVGNAIAQWKDLPAEERPESQVKAQRAAYANIINGEDDLLTASTVHDYCDGLLIALGYDMQANKPTIVTDPQTGAEIPVHLQLRNAKGSPQLCVLISTQTDAQSGILESMVDASSLTCEEAARALLGNIDEPPRWVLALGLHQAVLIDRRKWGEKQCLLFDFDTIYSRRQQHVFNAVAVLLHRSSLCPDGAESVLDSFDDESSRQSVAVSESLKSALRECVEILGNEVIYDWTHNKQRNVNDIDATDLTVQCLRYMYRLLFLLFIEAKPDLGYAPMKSESYRTAYSLESLRDLADHMRGRMDEAENTTYLADTLRQLDRLVFEGYPSNSAQLKRLMTQNITDGVFTVPPLKAHIFDPERTALVENAMLRDSNMLTIIDLMSVTNAGQNSKGKRARKQRISYAALGISQMGAVYEALLSYRGFIAKERLYEVKKANDGFDPLNVGYFVNASQLDDYSEQERVRYTDGPNKGELRTYEPGAFIYRLAGRERETSASFYTPDSLAQCLVKYALKELRPRIQHATDILQLKICEPAMGSATFLNETINQLASMYLEMREHERIEAEGASAAIPAERRQAELQRVKMFIADRNIYGIDLNPIAVELGEVSLWLNTICEGSFVPWFGTQLICGNSLIGARRCGYLESELREKTKNRRWYEKAPKYIGFNQSSSHARRVYQFLTGDPGMCSYDNKVVKDIEANNLATIKEWKKKFTAAYQPEEIAAMRALSKVADELWRGQIRMRRELERETRDVLAVYGYDDSASARHMRQEQAGQGTLEDVQERKVNLTIREKDEMLNLSYRSQQATNASEYARLKLAMDYWCALWFWPIDKADELPTRSEYLRDMSLILTGEILDDGFSLAFEEAQPTLMDAAQSDDTREYMRDHKVNLDELRANNERIRLAEQIAKEQRFFHWELEFADVFKDGGFDFMIGNPPWVNVQWNETDAISDVNPLFVVHQLSAATLSKKLPEILQNSHVRQVFLYEYSGIAGALAFYGAIGNYPLLQRQRTNLFRCFLPNAWDYTKQDRGISAFVHPDAILGDANAGELRAVMYSKLRMHCHFVNKEHLFSIDGKTEFSLNVYSNKSSFSFDSIWNLNSPKEIDECYMLREEKLLTRDSSVEDRIVQIGDQELQTFHRLFVDSAVSHIQAPLATIRCERDMQILNKIAQCGRFLRDYGNEITYSSMWNETNSRKDGIVKDEVSFSAQDEVIYTSPIIGLANSFSQSAKEKCTSANDYIPVDLTCIPDEYRVRTKYVRACSESDYRSKLPKMADGSDFSSVYRLCNREFVSFSNERGLISSCVHPGVAWVHTIAGYGVHPERYALLALMSGLQVSIPYDFFIRCIGKPHVNKGSLSCLPVPDTCLSEEIILRGLLLNCLTKSYAELWQSCWEDSFASMSWSKNDSRLIPETFTSLTSEWSWNTPLRTDYERRQALVELDVLSAMALGITLEELVDIYRLTFTVLSGYEDDTWYDANGRIAFSKKNYGNLTFSRKEFEAIRHAKAGEVFTRTIEDDTQPGGPRERTIKYVAPFDKCDRIADYKTAYTHFTQKYQSRLSQEHER